MWNDYGIWDFEKVFELNDKRSFTLQGHAEAGKKSGFYIKELKLMLDAGIQSLFSPQDICITHLHSDHAFAFPMIVKNIASVPQVHVPEKCSPLLQNFVDSLEIMSNDGQMDHHVGKREFVLNEACVGNDFYLQRKFGSNAVKVNFLKTFHSVRSVGYCFFEECKRLRSDLVGKSKEELSAMARNSKTSLNEIFFKELLVYTGDTDIRVFDDPLFLQHSFPFIITECSFFSELEPDAKNAEAICKRAEEFGHVEFSHLVKHVLSRQQFSQTLFILTHFSSRYCFEQIVEHVKKQPVHVQERIFLWPN